MDNKSTLAYTLAKNEIENALKDSILALGLPLVDVKLQQPVSEDFGDFSTNVAFQISKSEHEAPGKIAKKISSSIQLRQESLVSSFEPHESGYVNFRLARDKYTARTITEIISNGFFVPQIKKNLTITVEHSSVNPNKALHVGHLRNVILGDTIVRISNRLGGSVVVLNYIDDSGLQIADLIVGFKFLKFSPNPKDSSLKFDHYCGDKVYVQVQKEYQRNPSLLSNQRQILKELEDVDSETSKFARELTNRILLEQLKTCWRIGASYDCLVFESDILAEKMWNRIFEKLKQKGTIRLEKEGKNVGCWVADVPGEESDKVIVRNDGTLTYVGKDIPFAAWKLGLLKDTFGYKVYMKQPDGKLLWRAIGGKSAKQGSRGMERPPRFSGSDVVITVIDSRQGRLQSVIQKLLSEYSGKNLEGNYIHLGYAIVSLTPKTAIEIGVDSVDAGRQEISMSGRKGIYVNADDILDKLKTKALGEAKKRNPNLTEEDLQEIAEQVAIAAIRFELLTQDLDKTILFDLDRSLQLEGETGPYLQYAYARGSRIIEKYGSLPKSLNTNFADVTSDLEFQLTKQISKFADSVVETSENMAPKFLTRYSYRLAYLFNSFYEKFPVISEENKGVRESRLFLVEAFRRTLKESLSLLGIPAPERI